MFPPYISISPEISLELLAPRHAVELFALTNANRNHLRTWLPWVDGTKTVNDTLAFIENSQAQFANRSGCQSIIRFEEHLVGVIGLHQINWRNRSTSMGYWLAKDAQGQGIMSRSCQTYINQVFGDLELHRIEIRCAVKNTKSRAIPERLGFRAEGVIRDNEWLYDHYVDSAVYGLLTTDLQYKPA